MIQDRDASSELPGLSDAGIPPNLPGPVKLRSLKGIVSAKMPNRKGSEKKLKKALDTFSERSGRGRPALVAPSVLRGRADSYRYIFGQVWDRLWPNLSQSRTEQEVTAAFEEGASPYAAEFVPVHAKLILRVLREPRFPKRREAQINFMADSLAALGEVAPRSSRDICQKERAGEKHAHHILRYEYWIECSCGFKGHSYNHGCPECGAQIGFRVSGLGILR